MHKSTAGCWSQISDNIGWLIVAGVFIAASLISIAILRPEGSVFTADGSDYSIAESYYDGEFSSISSDNIASVTTSGYLPASDDRTFDGYCTIDGNPDTCWLVNNDVLGGSGSWIQYDFGYEQVVHGLKMINGNVRKEDYYYKNGHIKEFHLEFSDGTSISCISDEIYSRSTEDNIFFLDQPIATSYVKLVVDSSYIGSKDEYRSNTAMAEIEFF